MFIVQFTTLRAIEHTDARAFESRVGKWLTLREAENSYLLGELPRIVGSASPTSNGMRVRERLFTVEDGDQLVAVGILFGGGCFCMTWATDDMVNVLADFMANAQCQISNVLAPGHVSWSFSRKWVELTRQRFEFGRDERIYQLAHCAYAPPASGKLEHATEQDRHLLQPWVIAFIREAEFEPGRQSSEEILNRLIAEQALFIWKDPETVSMAAWLSPTANGGSINFVYTPPEYRGRGHAKAVTAALAHRMLASGRKYCFIMTDTRDARANHLYQSIGGRTLCELLRCTIHPQIIEPEPIYHANGMQNISRAFSTT